MDDVAALCLQLRETAEAMFGPARSDWSLGEVLFRDDEGGPRTMYRPFERLVDIELSQRARGDSLQLVYQLAHEVCHTLHPSMNGETLEVDETSILNEGISTWFSCFVCDRFEWGEIARESTAKNIYAKPLRLVTRLLEIDLDAITKLRAFQPQIDRLAPSDFDKAGVSVPIDLAEALCQPF
jgi:hypothetical protein